MGYLEKTWNITKQCDITNDRAKYKIPNYAHNSTTPRRSLIELRQTNSDMTLSSPKVNGASNQSLPPDNTAHISTVSSPHVRLRKLVVHSPHDSEFCMLDAGN